MLGCWGGTHGPVVSCCSKKIVSCCSKKIVSCCSDVCRCKNPSPNLTNPDDPRMDLPILDEKWPHSRGNVGNYFLFYIEHLGKAGTETRSKNRVDQLYQATNQTKKCWRSSFPQLVIMPGVQNMAVLEFLQPRKRSEGKKGDGPNSM